MEHSIESSMIKRIKIPLYQSQLNKVQDSIIKGELVYGQDLIELEQRLKEQFNFKYALLTSNGTSAIFLTLLAIDLKDKEVVLPAVSSCFAMVNAVKNAGYKIKFADVDIESMALAQIEDENAIVLSPNHFGKIASFNRLGREYTIEDSCQSFLSSKAIKNKTTVTILSFYPTKFINGIDGGVILTDDIEIYEGAKSLISYGTQQKFEERASFNMRLDNIHASFALASMEHLDEISQRLIEIYQEITDTLKERDIKFLEMDRYEVPSKLILRFRDKRERDSAFNFFLENGIEASLEWMFIAPQQEKNLYPNANILIDTTLSLPFHPLLTDEEILKIQKYIRKI